MSSTVSSSPLPTVTNLHVDSVTFPPSVTSPASSNPLFLGGAGVRGLEIQGNFVVFTVIGVYLEANAITSLSVKWKGKTTEELTESIPFFREIVTGGFEKFIKVTMKLPLTGQQYSEKVTENCVAIWKSLGIYTDSVPPVISTCYSHVKIKLVLVATNTVNYLQGKPVGPQISGGTLVSNYSIVLQIL